MTDKPKKHRILVEVTPELEAAFRKFRGRHTDRNWSKAKMVTIFAEAGVRVWEHEELGITVIPERVVMDPPSFAQVEAVAPTPQPIPQSALRPLGSVGPDDNFPFEGQF